MRRLSLCRAAVVGVLALAPAALADGPIYVTVGGAGVVTHDGKFHFVTVPNGNGGTLLEKLEVGHGRLYWWMTLPGSWGTPSIGNGAPSGQGLSRDGHTLVLASTGGPYSSPSKFLVVDPRRAKVVRTITLRGSFTFDAMAPDGSRMYLIQYTRAASNDLTHYVVRAYDLRTNRLLPGRIADRTDDEKQMAGYAVTRTTSADGRWVYTLYQRPNGMPFVHALDTIGAAAYCIDLPANKALYNVLLSLRDGGRTLAVRWRSGRPWLNVAVGTWRVSSASGTGFPWAWTAGGVGGVLALLAASALLLRRRRAQEVHEHLGQELGLA
jgi:hypothetical protein